MKRLSKIRPRPLTPREQSIVDTVDRDHAARERNLSNKEDAR